ncbi:O-antigen ligase family protein [Paenibacillus sp. sptzw28]|uniref:O-antigen ligase family protein n=1 Tax=Paenibacillus sp. sptzw28 TaxID=715179 RepID=UPI001C6EFFA3|nr:O-antigen ligase family protein [Paenibacillus sp. sptzw28]QYR23117.1 O-antigen ligase family protein [Paenibacillus sp. sptzw28]
MQFGGYLVLKRSTTLMLTLAIIVVSYAITFNWLLAPIAACGIVLLYLISNFKITLVFVLFASTMNGLNIASPLLKLENASILLSIAAIFLFVTYKRGKMFLSSEVACFIIFIAYSYYVSSRYSPVFDQSVHGMIQITIAFLGLVVMLQLRNYDFQSQLSLIKVYVLISVLQTIYGLASFTAYRLNGSILGGLMFGQGAESVTLKGTFIEANLFGAFVAVGLILCLALLINKMVAHVRLWYLASIILFVGLVFSWTRSAWIGFALALAVMAVYNFRSFLNPKTVVRLAVTLTLIVVPSFLLIQNQFDHVSGENGLFISKLSHLFDHTSGTGGYRVQQFNSALDDVQGHELLGKGYYSIKVYGSTAWISNMYLFIYHDTGIVGCIIFFLVILSIMIKGVRGIKRTRDKQRKIMITALLSGALLYLFSFNFTPGHTLSMFWIHLGLLLAVAGNSREEEMPDKPVIRVKEEM